MEIIDHEASHLAVAYYITIFDTMGQNDPRREFAIMAASEITAESVSIGDENTQKLMNLVSPMEFNAYIHDSPHAVGYNTSHNVLDDAGGRENENRALRQDVQDGTATTGRSYADPDNNGRNPIRFGQPGYDVYIGLYTHNLDSIDKTMDMQTGLRELGLYYGPIDGSIDQGTAAAMIAYFQTYPQAQERIEEEHLAIFMQTGNAQQIKQIFDDPASPLSLRFREYTLNRSPSSRIEEKQTWLAAAGYYDGPIDDQTNPEYEEAFRRAQTELLVETVPTYTQSPEGEVAVDYVQPTDLGLIR